MYVLPVPVLTFRMSPMEKMEKGYDAGIHADCPHSPFTLQVIIPGQVSIRDGGKEYYINFHTCPTDRTFSDV